MASQAMESERPPSASPWQPLTLGGLAAFAQASYFRLAAFQTAVGLIVGATMAWTVYWAWMPVLNKAILQLPETAQIHDGQMIWPGPPAVRLAENEFLSVSVDLHATGETGSGSDLQIELAANHLKLRSLLGYLPLPYWKGWIVTLNRLELEAWWGAWKPPLLAGVIVFTALGVNAAWSLLALLYAQAVKVVAFYGDRALPPSGAWRLSVAVQFPGALMFCAAIVAYSLHRLNLIQLLWACLLHIVLSWLLLLAAPLRLPREAKASPFRKSKNPFRK